MAERGALAATADFLALDPERFISATQARWLRPLSRGEEIGARLLYRFNRRAMRALFRLEVIGRENLPASGNFICAPNHASVLDPLAVAAAFDFDRLRHTYWAGWTGMAFGNALLRSVSRLAQVLPIEQERAAYSSLAMSLLVLQRGKNLIWFPEGGRARDGRLQVFRTGISLLLEHQPTPVVPMLITGTHDAMPIGRRLPRLCPVRVVIGRPLSVDELERRGQGATRVQRIADGLREAVRSLANEQPEFEGAAQAKAVR
jgi:long-chain acyl-CoA synthetase